MKIIAVCGQGLGSSFLMEMNIKKVLQNIGVEAEVSHSDLGSVNEKDADLFVMGADIFSSSGISPEKVILVKNLVSSNEYDEKLRKYFEK